MPFVWEGDELVGHASMVQRRLLHRGRALRAGYIEGVAVRAKRRRGQRGHGAAMDALERVVSREYELGALPATDDAADLYGARSWNFPVNADDEAVLEWLCAAR